MRHIAYLVSLLFALTIASCHDENSGGPEKVRELTVIPGANRAQIEFAAPDGAVTSRVFYNKGDYKDFTIDPSKQKQSWLLDSLPEGEQIFRVVTYNSKGNLSDPKGVKTTIYGNSYQASLEPRTLLSLSTLSPTSVELIFDGNKREDALGIKVSYVNLTGEKDSILFERDLTTITLKNIDLSKDYYFCTVFKPISNCLDEFETSKINAKEVALKRFEKEKWSVAAVSDEANSHEGAKLIDNDILSFWHSQPTAMPHWVAIDMQSEKLFTGFHIVQAQEPGATWFSKDYRFEISQDNNTWEVVSEGSLKANCYKQSVSFGKSVRARFYRLTILNGYADDAKAAQMAEIDLFNDENVSGENGGTVPALVNASIPYQGDGSDLFPSVGAGRMQKVTGWTHSSNAYITLDTAANILGPWCAPVWGIGAVSNGKIYQTLDLMPGNYVLRIDVGAMSSTGAAEMYGVVATGTTLPDYDVVTTSSDALGYNKLTDHVSSAQNIRFVVKTASKITLGIVYNLYNTYPGGAPWSYQNINGFTLSTQ